jgi:hypothetical protein
MSPTAELTRPVESETPGHASPRKRSKSEAPKSQRVPYAPDNPLTPNPDDYFASAAYIDQQNAMGAFDGAPGGTVALLQYAWRHTARNAMDGQTVGWVLTSKSVLGKIVSETGISMAAARRALSWLVANGWMSKIIDPAAGNAMSLRVRMDLADHQARQLRAPATKATSAQPGPDLRSQGAGGPLSQSGGSAHTERTLQGLSGVCRASEAEAVPSGREDGPSGEDPSGSNEVPGNGPSGPLGAPGSGSGSPGSQDVRAMVSTDPTGASGDELDRSFTLWERDGTWFVFPVATVKRPAKTARTVILTAAEHDFYRTEFRGDGRDNTRRAAFLTATSDERTALIEETGHAADHPDRVSNPGVLAPAGVAVKLGRSAPDDIKVWFSGPRNERRVWTDKPDRWDHIGYLTQADYATVSDLESRA